jgi:hypothetical protein
MLSQGQRKAVARERDEDTYVELPFGGERNARISVVELPAPRFTLDKTIVRIAARQEAP